MDEAMDEAMDEDMNEVLLAERYYKLKEKQEIFDMEGNIFLLRLFYYLCFCFGMLMLLFIDFDIIFYFSETDEKIKNEYENVISIQMILSSILLFFSFIAYLLLKRKEKDLEKKLEINFDDIA